MRSPADVRVGVGAGVLTSQLEGRVWCPAPQPDRRSHARPGVAPGGGSTRSAGSCPEPTREEASSTTESELEGRRMVRRLVVGGGSVPDQDTVVDPRTRRPVPGERAHQGWSNCQSAVLERDTDQQGSRSSTLSRRWRCQHRNGIAHFHRRELHTRGWGGEPRAQWPPSRVSEIEVGCQPGSDDAEFRGHDGARRGAASDSCCRGC